ncbi:endoribonuclease SymE [Rahnella sp. SAP-1]|uniref:Endoribonuclease SymE n=2 Tax=Rouxiella aceris TaxID=2703884 RepID=A0A848MJZ7_9GAMM|nr:endoribonuclease SymE [Rouxiella aceris]
MAEQDSKSEVVTTEVPELKTRRYTVGYIRDWQTHEPSPAITLKGNWLEDAGFETGTALKVRVVPGCLVLTTQEPQPEEPEIMHALKKACKLSGRRQQQIVEFITLIATPKKRPLPPGTVVWEDHFPPRR